MRDKRSEINQEYINASWLEMKDALDIHLPEKKGKRFLWVLLPIALIIVAFVMYKYPLPNDKTIVDSHEIFEPDKKGVENSTQKT